MSFLKDNMYVSRAHFLLFMRDEKMHLRQFSKALTFINNKSVKSSETVELPAKTFELAIRKSNGKDNHVIRCSEQ